ncbi:DinB family protein [Thalassomonas actiniarum]|uniref:DinB family protein n=1 Tax=Thalassomonas actiniarum TaxID=485447 RepID=A0AAE9YWC7_9GAMM|nr:DinB family protein [Thalassomonas actiniarum]WDE01579.1 DinB family protein [Thalassomonas actiniarum]
MSLVKNFRMLSRYNIRINRQLLGCCEQLSTQALTKESHSFFPNVISYWNHLLFGDLILLKRLAANNLAGFTLNDFDTFPEPVSPQDIYHQELTDIRTLREQVDQVIVEFFANLTDDECAQLMSYTSTEGELITKCVADVCQHLFNHQSHHRGQLTCVLSQLGIDYGCMDLPVLVPEGSGL